MNTPFANSTLKYRLLKGIGANAYAQLVSVITQLLSVPIFLHFWGTELYGEWLMLSTIPIYLSLSDVGFSSVAANEMTMQLGRGNERDALKVYQSIWVLVSATSAGAFALILAFSAFRPFATLISLHSITEKETSFVIFFLILYALIGLQSGVLHAAFRATGNYATGTVINNTVRLAEWISTITAIALGGHTVAVAIALAVTKSVATIVQWLVLRRLSPWLNLGFAEANRHAVRKLCRPAFAFMAFPIGSALNIQGMVIVVGILVNPGAVVIFSTYRTLTRLLLQGVGLVNHAIWPEISAAYGAGEFNAMSMLYRKASAVAFWLGLLGVVFIGLCGELILKIWTHSSLQPNHVLLALLLAATFLNILWQTSMVLLLATNMHQRLSMAFITAAVTAIAASALLIPKMGVNGAGLAILILEIPMLFFAIKNGIRLSDEKWSQHWREVTIAPLISMKARLQRYELY
jgi:O-antigen/teichoic acid export membrane protein